MALKNLNLKVNITDSFLIPFCNKWGIEEFSLFGSVLREDFSESSDIDIILKYSSETKVSLFDIMDMKEELENYFGRKVDIVNKKAIEKSKNPYRKENIMNSYSVVYEKK